MKNDISYKRYKEDYYRNIDSLTEKELIEAVEYLKGKKTSDEYEEIEDCAVDLVSRLLTMDWGRSIVIDYTKEHRKFIKSEYLSNYFKESIKLMLGDEISEELLNILNSNKNINDMTEDEIKTIKAEIDNYYKVKGKSEKPNISSRFMSYIYKLDGKGIVSYIKNNVDSSTLARQILITSGLNDRSSYYSGRGVNYGDLNDKHLAEIYRKLLVLDYNYASNFVGLVNRMRTLGATEFIDSFIRFGYSGFGFMDKNSLSESNISLDGVSGNAAYIVGAISLYESSRRNEDYQLSSTEDMKLAFHHRIDLMHRKISSGEILTEDDFDMFDKMSHGNYRYYSLGMRKPGIRRRY